MKVLRKTKLIKTKLIYCSFKQIKAAIKEDESVLLAKKSKGVDVGRAIYELIQNGIKGVIKKDALITTLTDLTVSSIEMIFHFCSRTCMLKSRSYISAHAQRHRINRPRHLSYSRH